MQIPARREIPALALIKNRIVAVVVQVMEGAINPEYVPKVSDGTVLRQLVPPTAGVTLSMLTQ